jgi:hypothetical protein
VVSLAIPAGAAERHMMEPLVPADKLAATRGLTSPLPSSPEIVEQGKALDNGKGACFNCHGKDGGGNGPAAAKLDPAPRILAPSYGRRNILGDHERIGRYRHGWIWRATDGRRNLEHHPIHAQLRRRVWTGHDGTWKRHGTHDGNRWWHGRTVARRLRS